MIKKKLIVCLSVILIVLLAVVAALNFMPGLGNAPSQDGNQTKLPNGASTTTQGAAMDYCVPVETVYGTLYYQDQWIDYMVVQQQQSGNTLTVKFQAQIADVVYSLFTLTIGEPTEAAIGKITDGSGTKRDVVASMDELGDLSELSEEEKNRLYAMQEDINFVIENLR